MHQAPGQNGSRLWDKPATDWDKWLQTGTEQVQTVSQNCCRQRDKTAAGCGTKRLQTVGQNSCRLQDKTLTGCRTKLLQIETKLQQIVTQNSYRLWDKTAADWGTKLLQSETKLLQTETEQLQAVGQNCYRLGDKTSAPDLGDKTASNWGTKHLQATVGQNCYKLWDKTVQTGAKHLQTLKRNCCKQMIVFLAPSPLCRSHQDQTEQRKSGWWLPLYHSHAILLNTFIHAVSQT